MTDATCSRSPRWTARPATPSRLVARSAGSTRPARRERGGREGRAHTRRRRARARLATAAVLEPYAFAELLHYFALRRLQRARPARGAELRAGRLGEQVFDERFSLADDALDPRGLPKAFDFEGTPKQRVDAGRGRRDHRRRLGPRHRRARRRRAADAPATRRPARCAHWGPLPFALSVAGGEAGVDRGAGRARRRRDLRHPPPLPEHRRRRARA